MCYKESEGFEILLQVLSAFENNNNFSEDYHYLLIMCQNVLDIVYSSCQRVLATGYLLIKAVVGKVTVTTLQSYITSYFL
jgi:hypothetical protein